MKILVLNGSPKGELSITLQYVRFIQKKFPQHEMKVVHISQMIKKLERDETAFQEIINEVRSSDGVLWAFGLFVLAVPSQYMRFIELISEKRVADAFRDKYAAVLSTSIHFFDHTAHNYMRAVCKDLNMKYAEALSLDIIDLMKESERRNLTIFAENIRRSYPIVIKLHEAVFLHALVIISTPHTTQASASHVNIIQVNQLYITREGMPEPVYHLP
jgi:NAD(P)H-dependent FMN reductase